MRSTDDTKRCSACMLLKELEQFPGDRSRSDGLDVYCRTCTPERMQTKRARYISAGMCADCGATREGSPSRRYCLRCASFYSKRATQQSRELRTLVLQAYGGAIPSCRCCGESEQRFLTLDHEQNSGRVDRRVKGTQGVLRELKRSGFPPGIRVLCFNCNMARGAYGACPHERMRLVLQPGLVAAIDTLTPTGERRCTRCHHDLPRSAFYPSKLGRDGLQSRCRTCTREASTDRLRAARREALAHYGNGNIACKCCGQREEMFLALDHIGGQGPRQPRERSGGNTFFVWLKKQGFPPGLQVLCHNCNCAKGRSSTCPHQVRSSRTDPGQIGSSILPSTGSFHNEQDARGAFFWRVEFGAP
jgi:hypothetical protein